ncbi:MAG TPA: ATP-dependent Clp protease ATP-binding subunit [Bacilli bacterium]|nr:ATP-dependent Clp protease ATP-binding subunit [Bacilli bacterium]
MFGSFSEEARKIIVSAKEEMYSLKHPYIGSEHLLLAILKDKNNISKRLSDYKINYKKVKDEIIKIIGIGTKENKWFLYTPMLRRIIENAIIDSKDNNSDVTIENLFLCLLEEGDGVAIRILVGMNIDIEELYLEFSKTKDKKKKTKKMILDELGIDLTKKALNNELDPVIGREQEINRVIEILSRRTKNNPILVGAAGVGKTAIVEELSRRIVNNEVPNALKNKRIISIDMASTVAGTKYRGEFEERLKKILKEVEENDDIILFIDEIHTLVGAGGAEGAIDASNIFKPALARNKLKCIGATTISEYKKYIEEDSALERRFQKVFIEIPTKEDTRMILKKLKPIYEEFHNVRINDEIINLIIDMSDKYIFDRNQPDKAIDVLDEVCARVSLKENKYVKKYNDLMKELENKKILKNDYIIKNKYKEAKKIREEENIIQDKINKIELKIYKDKNVNEVLKEDVASIISSRTKIPLYEILNDNIKIIETLEKKLKDNVIGQEKAINEVVKITKKIKLGFKDDNKCYSFMFNGPSGVGKTFLARLFGEELVGSNNVIKIDMSEFKDSSSVSKILGASPGYVGYSDNKNILEEIRNKPYSVLILDEIEKAHPDIINLFLQILEDSKIKDSKGNMILFNNVIIIMTSNVLELNETIGFMKNDDELSKEKEYFSIPFLNRIDSIVHFNKLNDQDVSKIINNKLLKLKSKYKDKEVNIEYNKNTVLDLINKINYKEFGARKIDKVLRDEIENFIIDKIIEKETNINISDYTFV